MCSRKMWHAVHRMNHITGHAQARMWSGLLTIVDAHGHSNDGEADGADSGDCVDVADGMEVRALGQEEVAAPKDNDVLCERHARLPTHYHIDGLRHSHVDLRTT